MDHLVELRGIHRKFDNKVLFNGFDLKVKEGEKIALKGKSGSGKSTLMRMIMGFEFPESGNVRVFDRDLSKRSIKDIRKQTAWLPQDFNILGSGTVESVIMTPCTYNYNKKNCPAKTEIINSLDKLGFESNILDKDFEDLSGGEKQRVGLVIIKLLKRPLTLLDEPSSALDSDSIARAAEFILKDKSMTVISASHNEEWIENCDRIIDLQELGGKYEQH